MQYLESFLTAKTAAGLSPETLRMYTHALFQYQEFCVHREVDPHARATVEQYLVVCQARLQPSTVAAYYRVLHVYFGWLVRREHAVSNPLASVEKPRIPKRRREHVTLPSFRRLYAAIPMGDAARWVDHRDRALLTVLFYSGLRVAEMLGMQTGDVDLVAHLITVRRGKGGNARVVPCAPQLAEPLMSYLYTRPPWPEAKLWAGSDGRFGVAAPLGDEGVRMMLHRRCAAAGVRYASPHQFRHGFAMAWLNAGMDMSALAAVMGHSSQATTEQVYARWLTDGLSREYNQALRRLTGETG